MVNNMRVGKREQISNKMSKREWKICLFMNFENRKNSDITTLKQIKYID